jgi:quercetin dioxygenase-like cupin family protein
MLRTAEQSEKYAVAGDVYAFLATGEDTDGAYALVEAYVPVGGGPPPHTQQDLELFYVLEGEITFTVEGKDVAAGPGAHLKVAPGIVHAFRNNSERPARMLIQTLPAGLDRYFREVGRPVDSMKDHAPATEEDIARIIATAPKYGIEIRA